MVLKLDKFNCIYVNQPFANPGYNKRSIVKKGTLDCCLPWRLRCFVYKGVQK